MTGNREQVDRLAPRDQSVNAPLTRQTWFQVTHFVAHRVGLAGERAWSAADPACRHRDVVGRDADGFADRIGYQPTGARIPAARAL